MKRLFFAAAAVVVPAIGSRAAETPGKPPVQEPPRLAVRVDRAGDADRIDARFDAYLWDLAILVRSDGSREILVLVDSPKAAKGGGGGTGDPAPCDPHSDGKPPGSDPKPKRLFRLDPSGQGSLQRVRDDVPAEITSLAVVDADGDGNDDLVLVRPGRVEVVRDGPEGPHRGKLETWIEDPGVDLPVRRSGLLGARVRGDAARLRFATVGALRSFGPGAVGERWKALPATPLPVESDDAGDALAIRSPLPRAARGKEAPAIWGTPAEVVGPDRLRFRLLEPEAAEDRRSVECWARLPGRERVLDQALVMLDGAPALVVATMPADKLALFGEKKLRVFRPAPDRTRTGSAPLLAADTSLNLWQMTHPLAADVDGDGREDLILPYWKGLKNTIVAFDVFTRKPDGSFADSPRTSSFDVEDGERGFLLYGTDLDGDGIGDLLLVAGKALRIHAGLRDTRGGKRLVSETPTLSAPLPADFDGGAGYQAVGIGAEGFQSWTVEGALSDPVPVVLDDGEPPAILVRGNDGGANGRVVMLRFSRKPGSGGKGSR